MEGATSGWTGTVAIKVLPEDVAQDDEDRLARFETGGQGPGRPQSHPNILAIHESRATRPRDRSTSVTMELLEGESLCASSLPSQAAAAWRKLLGCSSQPPLPRAVSRGPRPRVMVHRDLKPENRVPE